MDTYTTTPKAQETIAALWRLEKIILDTLDFNEVVQKIVNSVLSELGYLNLGYRIIVLTLVDEQKQVLKRISISQTQEAKEALENSPIPFHNIDIPLGASENILIQALNEKKPLVSDNLAHVLCPPLKPDDVIPVQKAIGIKTTMAFPVISKGKAVGVMIFSLIKPSTEVAELERDLLSGFTDVVGLAVQNSQLYSSLEKTKNDLEQANLRLQSLDKMKDEFVSLASHELRTPMTAIKSYIWMALDGRGGPLTDKQKYYVDRAYKSTDRMINLVNEMLNISRIESGRITLEKSLVKPEELVKEVIDEVMPRAQELQITVQVLPHPDLPEIIIDADKIKEVMINLIGNSFKFTPAKGTITISFVKTDSMIEVQVSDTGIGIAPENIGKLFQKFTMLPESYAANPSVQGTGLGLYISKSIVELHNGKIWVHSDGLHKGATFGVSLPVPTQQEKDTLQMPEKNTIEKKLGLVHAQV